MPSNINCQDLIYYNIIIPHTGQSDYCSSDYHRMNTIPILDTPENYYMSVSRFSVPTRNIPILIPIVSPTNPNKLAYSVTLSSSGGAFEVTREIEYFSTSAGSTPATNPLHYFIFTYSHFVKMFNDTLIGAMTDLKSLDASIPVEVKAPKLIFNPSVSLFGLVAQKLYYGEGIVTNRINFYTNQYTFKLLDPLMVDYISPLLSASKGVRYYFFDKGNNSWDFDNTYFYMSQDYSILSAWSSLKSIEMEVGTIPVNYEYIEHDYNTVNKQTTSAPIMKDYLVLYRDSNQSVARTSVDYAVDESQYICLSGVEPLRELTVRLYWVDNNGKRYRLTLSNGEVINIKVLFKRKDLAY